MMGYRLVDALVCINKRITLHNRLRHIPYQEPIEMIFCYLDTLAFIAQINAAKRNQCEPVEE